MNKKLVGIIGTILSILILIYFESTMYKIINVVGIDLNSFSSLVNIIVNLVIKVIMCILIYFIYKKDFKKRYSNNNLIRDGLFLVIYLICLVLIMYIFRYIISFIGDIFDINVIKEDYYNIFNKTLDVSLVIKIISDYLIVPFLYCSIILLGSNKLCKHNNTFILFSGIIASVVYAFSISGTLGYVIINSLFMFVLFGILAFIYKKENSIWMSILLYGFYLISNNIIINYLGW